MADPWDASQAFMALNVVRLSSGSSEVFMTAMLEPKTCVRVSPDWVLTSSVMELMRCVNRFESGLSTAVSSPAV